MKVDKLLLSHLPAGQLGTSQLNSTTNNIDHVEESSLTQHVNQSKEIREADGAIAVSNSNDQSVTVNSGPPLPNQ